MSRVVDSLLQLMSKHPTTGSAETEYYVSGSNKSQDLMTASMDIQLAQHDDKRSFASFDL